MPLEPMEPRRQKPGGTDVSRHQLRTPDDASDAAPEPAAPSWRERFHGGSPEAERACFEAYARQIREVQVRLRKQRSIADRGLHAKMLGGTTRAILRVQDPQLSGGYFQAGAQYPVTLRFSCASNRRQDDHARDARGVALRVHTPDGDYDLLLTNAEVSHVRDADEFMRFVRATSHGMALGLLRLFVRRPRRTAQIVRALLRQTSERDRSLAHETFWSRAPFLLGGRPVRYKLEPHAMGAARADTDGPDFLFFDLKRRLRTGPVRYGLYAQPYECEQTTPLEDASLPWRTRALRVAELDIEQQELSMPNTEPWRAIDALAFSPWHAPDDMRPLGMLNRARAYVYPASQRERSLPLESAGCPMQALPALVSAGMRLLSRLR